MKILLDTCDFLWLIAGDSALPQKTAEAIRDPENEVFLSTASLWEILIKHERGKLPMPEPPLKFIPEQRALHGIESLAIEESSVKLLATLPPIHRDPFDRIYHLPGHRQRHAARIMRSGDRPIPDHAPVNFLLANPNANERADIIIFFSDSNTLRSGHTR